jgi:hypothetical protein
MKSWSSSNFENSSSMALFALVLFSMTQSTRFLHRRHAEPTDQQLLLMGASRDTIVQRKTMACPARHVDTACCRLRL